MFVRRVRAVEWRVGDSVASALLADIRQNRQSLQRQFLNTSSLQRVGMGKVLVVVFGSHVKQRRWSHPPRCVIPSRSSTRHWRVLSYSSDAELDRPGQNQADRHHRAGQEGCVQPAAPRVLRWVSQFVYVRLVSGGQPRDVEDCQYWRCSLDLGITDAFCSGRNRVRSNFLLGSNLRLTDKWSRKVPRLRRHRAVRGPLRFSHGGRDVQAPRQAEAHQGYRR